MMSPELSKLARIVPSAKMIVGLARNVEYQASSAEAKSAHGGSPVLAILDEVGQIKGPTDDFVEAIETSQGAYDGKAMLFAISTQAATDNDLFSRWIDDAETSKDPRIVSHIYRQERSRTAGGKTFAKDLGSPIWRASYVTKLVRANTVDKWRAILASMDGGIQTFLGVNLSRCYPIAYPRGSWPTGDAFDGAGGITGIDSNRKVISVQGFPPGFKLSEGDMIQVGTTDLHWVQSDAVANVSGVFPTLEVRPHLWPSVAPGTAVSVKRPHCIMSIDPDSVSSQTDLSTGMGSISFDAWEAR